MGGEEKGREEPPELMEPQTLSETVHKKKKDILKENVGRLTSFTVFTRGS